MVNGLTAASFGLLFVFLLLSNGFDWDHFFAAAEVDRRSWLLDAQPPLWSYQLCGGVTRAGDPQAFGLSPLFLPVVLLGSFWGLKALVVALAVLGYFSLTGLLRLFVPRRTPLDEAALRCVALAYVFGNFFLWHFHHGHLTFVSVFVALGILFFFCQALFDRFGWRQGVALASLSLCYASGGFYHSLVFFLVPAAGAAGLFLAALRFVPWKGLRLEPLALGRLVKASLSCAAGFALGGFKAYFVLAHQLSFPRTLGEARAPEGVGLVQSFVYQLAPTVDYQFAGLFKGWGPFGIWEYSAFSLNAWWAVLGLGALALALARRRPVRSLRPGQRRLAVLGAALLVAGLLFSQGDEGPLSLHRLLNVALSNSVRVVGRYQGVLSLGLACLALLAFQTSRLLRGLFLRLGYLAIPIVLGVNLVTFRLTARPEGLRETLGFEKDPLAHMTDLVFARRRTPSQSFMYQPTLLGGAVLNCYDPLGRQMLISREFEARRELMGPGGELPLGLLPLVDAELGSPSSECRSRSYFTQGEVVLDASCGPGVCVNLNGQNPYRPSALRLDPKVGKLCLPGGEGGGAP